MTEQTDYAVFRSLLANERGFHLLFCDLFETSSFSLYHNRVFAEDPIFNHFVIDDELLLSQAPLDSSMVRLVVSEIRSKAESFELNTTIFLENFWPRSAQFERASIGMGYRVADKMEVLTKILGRRITKATEPGEARFEIAETMDVGMWNKVFMSSYAIPRQWEAELLRREGEILKNRGASFILATDRKRANMPSGCLLEFSGPDPYVGIYCVGTIPEQRGKGVARQMLLSMEDHALTSDKPVVLVLQTLSSDGVAPMYKKMGYATRFERDILFSPSAAA